MRGRKNDISSVRVMLYQSPTGLLRSLTVSRSTAEAVLTLMRLIEASGIELVIPLTVTSRSAPLRWSVKLLLASSGLALTANVLVWVLRLARKFCTVLGRATR